ncbi:MAG: 50S ribosomal protein L15, partial [Solirubrobacteraceae bacterium]|nr:50S ribosomal protein L15 [Solirubrobacteraceae bacterium]
RGHNLVGCYNKQPAAAKPAAEKKTTAKSEAAAKPAPATTKKAATEESSESERFGLHSLSPAPGSRKPRRRVGRGHGSGHGKTSGRGHKGYGSRSGSKDRARFEGGQMPIQVRMRKLRGPNMKKSMPFEPFRTHTQAVNLKDLEAHFDSGADVTIEALVANGLGTRKNIPVKVLAKGEISKPLTVHAHGFSASARAAIEAAGGTCVMVGSEAPSTPAP